MASFLHLCVHESIVVETDAKKVKAALSAANVDKIDSSNSKAVSEARR